MSKLPSIALACLLSFVLLAGCSAPDAADETTAESQAAESSATEETSDTAASGESAASEDAADHSDLTPVTADRIEDGAYSIEVESSSSMFRVVDAQLTVADGAMTCVLTLSGTGYEKLYLGTGEEAAADSDDTCIYYVENDEGAYTYTAPVEALDQEIDCAAWSIRKQQWYDRVLVFEASSLPEGALKA